jgi:hypothetical protein
MKFQWVNRRQGFVSGGARQPLLTCSAETAGLSRVSIAGRRLCDIALTGLVHNNIRQQAVRIREAAETGDSGRRPRRPIDDAPMAAS